MWNDIIMAVLALAISLVLVPFVAKLAVKLGAVDKPNARKVHTKLMPRMGGLAIYLSFFAVLFLSHELTQEHIGLFVGGTVLVLVGIVDDIKDIPAKVKLLGQIAAACIVVLSGVRVEFMTNFILGGMFPLYIFSAPFTVLWIVAIINAVNLIDGLDGLAAGTSIIAATTMAISGYATGQTEMASIALILIGAALGFLKYNFHPAKIFMGDTGSLFLGAAIASSALSLNNPFILLGVGGVYVLEGTSVVIQVLVYKLTGKRVFKMAPLHQHLEKSGWSENKICITAILLTFLLSLLVFAVCPV